MDEFDANITPSDEANETQHPAGTSRRNFLKAAVVGSAAAVAASGVGAATLTLTGHHTGLKKYVPFIGGTGLSGVTGDACTTNTGGTIVDQSSYNKQESIYFWVAFHNVPAGDHVIDVSPTIGGPSTIVDYQNPSSSVKLYEYGAGAMPFTCHPSSLTSLPAPTMTTDTVPISFHLSNPADVLLQIHLQGNGTNTSNVIVALTATLYKGTESPANVTDSETATFTITTKTH